MNTKILQKCLEELSKDEPKLDYVRGMLETLIEMQDTQEIKKPTGLEIKGNAIPVFDDTGEHTGWKAPQDEASILDAEAKAKLEMIKSFNTEK